MRSQSLVTATFMFVIGSLCVAGNALSNRLPSRQAPSSSDSGQTLSTILMRSTFRIFGVNNAGRLITGTTFIMGQPVPGNSGQGRYVLVSAAHVLDGITDDNATLVMRTMMASGAWKRLPVRIPIRDSGTPRWTKHPTEDVAVMYVTIPADATLDVLPTSYLADDKLLERYEVGPGDEVIALGYPLGIEANDSGFPVLRSGRIASYPIRPTAMNRTFLFDFKVFPGNSGGPVYLQSANRVYGGETHLGLTQVVLGLVSQEKVFTDRVPLDLAVVVHSVFISETLKMLPPP